MNGGQYLCPRWIRMDSGSHDFDTKLRLSPKFVFRG